MSDLHDRDVVAWSERQGALLRRIAKGGRVESNELDWPNIAEEIESVGQSQIDAVESLVTLAFVHDLKATAWPLARDAPGWQADARLFRRQAKRKYRPSMRRKIDLAGLYDDAVQALPETLDGEPPLPVPIVCPVGTIEELLGAS